MKRPAKQVTGRCRLCGQNRTLLHSHIWPRFGYRDFVADQSKGGAFINLETDRYFAKQIREYWYCSECEQIFSQSERYSKELIHRAAKEREQGLAYSRALHSFCVSICLRTLEYCHKHEPLPKRGPIANAHSVWRLYLLGKQPDVRPYSIHLFLLFDEANAWHKAMGGRVFEGDIVLSQVGPLLLASPLNRAALPISDLKIWEKTQVNAAGGELQHWEAWRPGNNVTVQLVQLLKEHQHEVVTRIRSGQWGK